MPRTLSAVRPLAFALVAVLGALAAAAGCVAYEPIPTSRLGGDTQRDDAANTDAVPGPAQSELNAPDVGYVEPTVTVRLVGHGAVRGVVLRAAGAWAITGDDLSTAFRDCDVVVIGDEAGAVTASRRAHGSVRIAAGKMATTADLLDGAGAIATVRHGTFTIRPDLAGASLQLIATITGKSGALSAKPLDHARPLALGFALPVIVPDPKAEALPVSASMTPGSKGYAVVERVALDDYVAGSLFAEMPPTFADEALKAQAVAIRTYAMYRHIERAIDPTVQPRGFDLYDSVQDLCYRGLHSLPAADRERALRLVGETRGEVMTTRDGRLFLAYFHSTAGGMTSSAEHVFGTFATIGPLAGVAIEADGHSPLDRWTYEVVWVDVRAKLIERGLGDTDSIGWQLRAIEPARADAAGRALAYRLTFDDRAQSIEITSRLFRLAVGAGKQQMASTRCTIDLTVKDKQRVLVMRGRGWGHGVGMSQFGADGLARDRAFNYRQILDTYYPSAIIVPATDRMALGS